MIDSLAGYRKGGTVYPNPRARTWPPMLVLSGDSVSLLKIVVHTHSLRNGCAQGRSWPRPGRLGGYKKLDPPSPATGGFSYPELRGASG